jgi:hypothetical protein
LDNQPVIVEIGWDALADLLTEPVPAEQIVDAVGRL